MAEIEAVGDLAEPKHGRGLQPAHARRVAREIGAEDEIAERQEILLLRVLDEELPDAAEGDYAGPRANRRTATEPDDQRHQRHRPGFDDQRPHGRIDMRRRVRNHQRKEQELAPIRGHAGDEIAEPEADRIGRPQPHEPLRQKDRRPAVPGARQHQPRHHEKAEHRQFRRHGEQRQADRRGGVPEHDDDGQQPAQSVESGQAGLARANRGNHRRPRRDEAPWRGGLNAG